MKTLQVAGNGIVTDCIKELSELDAEEMLELRIPAGINPETVTLARVRRNKKNYLLDVTAIYETENVDITSVREYFDYLKKCTKAGKFL